MQGKFIIFDGIDGSGKTTALESAVKWLRTPPPSGGKPRKIFDLVTWSKKHHALPDADTFKPYDIIVSAEPTHTWIGAAIRGEIIRAEKYSGADTAAAFALDRQILYTRCIIPALKMGKVVLQDRSISSSIAYQPIQKHPARLKYILSLPGNKLALKYPPNLIIIADCPPDVALARIGRRIDKKDAAVFEQIAIMKKLHRRFHAAWYKNFWRKYGTRVEYLDTTPAKPAVAKETIRILDSFSRAA